jgi:hypothetical protein
VSTVAVPSLGIPSGLFVLADGTRLACAGHSIRVLAPSGLLSFLKGSKDAGGNQDGPGADARFYGPIGIMVDPAGIMVVDDHDNHALPSRSAPSRAAGGRAWQTGRARPRASTCRTAWW